MLPATRIFGNAAIINNANRRGCHQQRRPPMITVKLDQIKQYYILS